MKTKTLKPCNTKGYALIPGDRLDMLSKVIKKLQKDRVSFLMEDEPVVMIRALHDKEGTHTRNGNLLSSVDVRFIPGTRITWPDPEADNASA
jgi:hypothetical protein